jgi:hypothetical protein
MGALVNSYVQRYIPTYDLECHPIYEHESRCDNLTTRMRGGTRAHHGCAAVTHDRVACTGALRDPCDFSDPKTTTGRPVTRGAGPVGSSEPGACQCSCPVGFSGTVLQSFCSSPASTRHKLAQHSISLMAGSSGMPGIGREVKQWR